MNANANANGNTASSTEETPPEIISEFEKNKREVVRVSLTEYRGQALLDVRAYYKDGDEMKPGKGLSVRRELITPLRKALQAAEKAVKDNPQDTYA